MQFEVVLCLEGFLADLTLEPPPDAVSGEVASEVPFTREHLEANEKTDQTQHVHLKKRNTTSLQSVYCTF